MQEVPAGNWGPPAIFLHLRFPLPSGGPRTASQESARLAHLPTGQYRTGRGAEHQATPAGGPALALPT